MNEKSFLIFSQIYNLTIPALSSLSEATAQCEKVNVPLPESHEGDSGQNEKPHKLACAKGETNGIRTLEQIARRTKRN